MDCISGSLDCLRLALVKLAKKGKLWEILSPISGRSYLTFHNSNALDRANDCLCTPAMLPATPHWQVVEKYSAVANVFLSQVTTGLPMADLL